MHYNNMNRKKKKNKVTICKHSNSNAHGKNGTYARTLPRHCFLFQKACDRKMIEGKRQIK